MIKYLLLFIILLQTFDTYSVNYTLPHDEMVYDLSLPDADTDYGYCDAFNSFETDFWTGQTGIMKKYLIVGCTYFKGLYIYDVETMTVVKQWSTRVQTGIPNGGTQHSSSIHLYGTLMVTMEDWNGVEGLDYTTEGPSVLEGTVTLAKNMCSHSACSSDRTVHTLMEQIIDPQTKQGGKFLYAYRYGYLRYTAVDGSVGSYSWRELRDPLRIIGGSYGIIGISQMEGTSLVILSTTDGFKMLDTVTDDLDEVQTTTNATNAELDCQFAAHIKGTRMVLTYDSGELRVFEISPPDIYPIFFDLVKKHNTGQTDNVKLMVSLGGGRISFITQSSAQVFDISVINNENLNTGFNMVQVRNYAVDDNNSYDFSASVYQIPGTNYFVYNHNNFHINIDYVCHYSCNDCATDAPYGECTSCKTSTNNDLATDGLRMELERTFVDGKYCECIDTHDPCTYVDIGDAFCYHQTQFSLQPTKCCGTNSCIDDYQANLCIERSEQCPELTQIHLVFDAPSGYWYKSPSHPDYDCHYTCHLCIEGDNSEDGCRNCDTDNTNRELIGSPGKCECKPGYHEETPGDKICTEKVCVPKCLTCVLGDCELCPGQPENRDDQTCECLDGYIEEGDNCVVDCQTGITDKIRDGDQCICEDKKYMKTIECTNIQCDSECDSCDLGTIDVCLSCDDLCGNCSGPGSDECIDCDDDNTMRELVGGNPGTCECQFGFQEANPGDLICTEIPCVDLCLSCSLGICQQCPGQSENRDSQTCLCEDGYIQENDQCLINCHPDDTDKVRDVDQCICTDVMYMETVNCNNTECHAKCPACDIGTIDACLDCQEPCSTCSALNSCDSCIDGYFLSGDQCIECNSNCNTCDNLISCTTCQDPLLDPDTLCSQCLPGYYQDDNGDCQLCVDEYGSNCGTCNKVKCLSCSNNPDFIYPECNTSDCVDSLYKDGAYCEPCTEDCVSCQSGLSCDTCIDSKYPLGSECVNCVSPCLLCTGVNVCIQCENDLMEAPDCLKCRDDYFMFEGECTNTNPEEEDDNNNPGSGDDDDDDDDDTDDGPTYYPDPIDKAWKPCDQSCGKCIGEGPDNCTSCKSKQELIGSTCYYCFEKEGLEQDPDQEFGICREVCGDSMRFSDQGCDDGNNIDGDGCDSNCNIEPGFVCEQQILNGRDYCDDTSPISFSVRYNFEDQYLNLYENIQLTIEVYFNKTISITPGKQLVDLIVLTVENRPEITFDITVQEMITNNRRILSSQNQGSSYIVRAVPSLTMKNRNIEIDFNPKSDISDNYGTLIEEEPKKAHVKEYYHYSDDERKFNDQLQIVGKLSMVIIAIILSLNLFRYKNYFNRFYNLFFLIDLMQIIYFYRFINVRWPINGVFFFRNLKPLLTFYIYNYHKNSDNGENATGLAKFDSENESSSFLVNAGSLLTVVYVLIFVYLITFILTIRQLYANYKENKIYKFFYNLRYGYLEWGIMFDCTILTSGVFIVYFCLQYTNISDISDALMSHWIVIILFAFFIYSLVFTYRNQKELYNFEKELQDKETRGKKFLLLEDKIQEYPSFKFRNVWHFIENVNQNPKKAFIYYYFILRKFILSFVLITFQSNATVQIILMSITHIIPIILILKYKFFKMKLDIFKNLIGEIMTVSGLLMMYQLTDDSSEDEPNRKKYCYWILACWMFGLFIQLLCSLVSEIFVSSIKTIHGQRDVEVMKDFNFVRAYNESTRTHIKNVQKETGTDFNPSQQDEVEYSDRDTVRSGTIQSPHWLKRQKKYHTPSQFAIGDDSSPSSFSTTNTQISQGQLLAPSKLQIQRRRRQQRTIESTSQFRSSGFSAFTQTTAKSSNSD